jgi:hypothetical protein
MIRKQALKRKIAALEYAALKLHWMARRYADGRQSYAVGMFNDITRDLLDLVIKLNPTADGTIWAKDGMGKGYDGLTEAEAQNGTPEALGTKKDSTRLQKHLKWPERKLKCD